MFPRTAAKHVFHEKLRPAVRAPLSLQTLTVLCLQCLLKSRIGPRRREIPAQPSSALHRFVPILSLPLLTRRRRKPRTQR